MITLLYKPDSISGAFREYHSAENVVVIGTEVNIMAGDLIIEKFKLVKLCNPCWTDDTKVARQVLVKIIVEPIKVEILQ